MPLTAPPCLVIASPDDVLHDGIVQRLDGESRIRPVGSLSELARQLQPSDLGPTDILIIDLRRASHAERALADAWRADPTRQCRIVCFSLAESAGDPFSSLFDRECIAVDVDEPLVDFVSAVMHGEGHHDVLIATMRVLGNRLSPIGQQAVRTLLSRRFAAINVNGLAQALDVHRSRLHHMLLGAGDPTPKRLFDQCVTMVSALLVRGTDMPQAGIARFVRARHSRAPREAVKRHTGLTFAQLRTQLRVLDNAALARMVIDAPADSETVAA